MVAVDGIETSEGKCEGGETNESSLVRELSSCIAMVNKPEDARRPVGDAGRIKEPPICSAPELKKEALSSSELTKFCFPSKTEADCTFASESSRPNGTEGKATSTEDPGHRRQASVLVNAKVLERKTSRQGRQTQRWASDPKTNQNIRLVTGCVPIMTDGRILFVTSSRKNEWILPKGGWEIDETMEESAIRETFEEAGVLGMIGPRLSEIEYETRKARKRRLELEEMIKKQKKGRADNGFSSGCSDVVHSSEDEHQSNAQSKDTRANPVYATEGEMFGCLLPKEHVTERGASNVVVGLTVKNVRQNDVSAASDLLGVDNSTASSQASHKVDSNEKPGASDETCSLASDSSTTYAFVRMSLFPLYVTEVKECWPESGRFRKILDLDEGIKMMESRPEFRAALIEVKQKGLHLVTDPGREVLS